MKFFSILLIYCLMANIAWSQWTAVTALAPHPSGGGMLLLSDGTVLVKSNAGGTDGYGNTYDRLTPNINGSYIHGTWTSIAPMISTRLYYSSQVLKDGRVYVAGGEYGTGNTLGEVYNPPTNAWTATPIGGTSISDANSEILEDGRVLQALVGSINSQGTSIYTPATNTYVNGPNCLGNNDEAAWIKLPDNSILFVDILSTNSERYIPATNTWIADANVPVQLYDPFGEEAGGAVLLPDGRALFLGSTGHNAFYTPSGTTAPGVWAVAPDFPNAQGTPDAPAAMLVNGKVLCDVSPVPTAANHFPPPTKFYEFDPATNVFTAIAAPGGGASLNISSYTTTFLVLPDGNILYAQQGTNQYFVYTPTGGPQTAWRPTVNTVTLTGTNTYQVTGTQFNGISQGATYGDDWQMRTNYPLVRLVSGTNVYYARTVNWNSTGVRRGAAADNATFTLPAGLPNDSYSLFVIANGIASAPFAFTTGCTSNITITGIYSIPLTQSGSWIKSSAQTTALSTASVKLDADPSLGYVELKPAVTTDYFLAAPSTTSGVFVAQALDGCGSGVPSLVVPAPPIITKTLLTAPPTPPRHRSILANLDSLVKNNSITIFPNPAKNSIIVKSADDMKDAQVQVFDIAGRSQPITAENAGSDKRINWNYLSSGIYILKITSNKKTDIVKILIQ
jgi:Secretion system C-terminal sorting domain/Galactose oxidase, central domain